MILLLQIGILLVMHIRDNMLWRILMILVDCTPRALVHTVPNTYNISWGTILYEQMQHEKLTDIR